MTKFKIDFDKPAPQARSGARKGITASLLAMPAPDGGWIASAFFPNMHIKGLSANIGSVRKRYPAFATAKFTSRTVTENGVKGVRIWRIA